MAKKNNNPVEAEKLSEQEAETEAHLKSEPTQEEVAQAPDEEAQEAAVVEELTDTDAVVPAEVAAIHEVDDSTELEAGEPKSKLDRKKEKRVERAEAKSAKPAKKSPSSGGENKSRRSKKYLAAHAKVEPGKLYPIAEALALIKELSVSKFDGSVEIHFRLNKKKAKGLTESTRGIVQLPHGSGKEKKVVILDEKMIDEIAKTKKLDFDVAVATPELMPKIAKIAKILGPQGKMPDPKSGTVTNDPKKVIEDIRSGKTEYRVDASNNVHLIIGKVSWDQEKLAENAKAVLALYPKTRIASGYLTASIAPSIPLDLSKLS